jgi:chromosome transmission fidelity protein 1
LYEFNFLVNERASLQRIESFLLSLTNASLDGRILLTINETRLEMKYLLLNPADVFADITSQARAVILAGGTMVYF